MSHPKPEMTAWYVSRGGDATGPFATDMLLSMLKAGQLQPLDLVFREGEIEWKPVASFRDLRMNAPTENSKSSPPGDNPQPAMPASQAPGEKKPLQPARVADPRTLSWIVLRAHGSTFLQEGPLETQMIIDGLETGRFQFAQYAWHAGMSQWMRIGDLREFDRRSRSRDSKPHVPPPLPDPIAAVLLEDDADSEAEEFHVTMRGFAKQELTPNPLESMRAMGVTQLGNAAIGGAAGDSPEQKASRAVSLVVGGDLAGVPWEQDASDGYAPLVELIDDEQSGINFEHASEVSQSGFGFTKTPLPQMSHAPAAIESESLDARLEKTPHPFLPGVPMLAAKDAWLRWGRYAAGSLMLALAVIFGWHLATTPSRLKLGASAAKNKVAPNAPPVAAVRDAVRDAVTAAPITAQVIAPSTASGTAPGAAPSTAPGTPAVAGSPRNLEPSAGVALNDRPVVVPPVVSNARDLGIVGLKLDRPDGQIVVQGSFLPNDPIKVTFKGRLGEILSKMSVRKTVTVMRKNGEVPSVRLKDLKLPAGSYTVEVDAAGTIAKNEIFVGTRDAKFVDKLESHLRDVSLEAQNQKKTLFYAAQELNVLARDLGQNYGQLRGKPELWSSFFGRWKPRLDLVTRSLADVSRKPPGDQAYPEETSAIMQVTSNLKEVADQYEQAVGQRRDIASDSLSELIAELTRQKELIGRATSRPTANTPDGKL